MADELRQISDGAFTERIEVRLTGGEKALVEEAAARAGFANVPDFMRAATLSCLGGLRGTAGAAAAGAPGPRKGRPRAAWWLLLLDLIAVVVAYLAVLAEVESVIVTGPILVVLGVATCVVCGMLRYGLGVGAGVGHVLISVLFVTLVNALSWSPRAAETPFRAMGLIYLAAFVPLGVIAMRRIPAPHDPGKCEGCGYPLYGLTSPRCPECGKGFDMAVLATLAPPPQTS
jgi:hypothetical protein